MQRILSFSSQLVTILFVLAGLALISASAQEAKYEAAFLRWRGVERGFDDWVREGVHIAAGGALRLDPTTARRERDPYPPAGFYGRNYFNGDGYLVGEALSPVASTSFPFTQAVASWNAGTPLGTWIETQIRARLGERWTEWYSLGVWSASTSPVARHSVGAQADADGSVDVDTLMLHPSSGGANALQLRVRVYGSEPVALPTLRNVSVAYSTAPVAAPGPAAGNPQRWGRVLEVPECSQMVYPEGGDVWCSPTSTAMVLSYWKGGDSACEPRVRLAAARVYDWFYDGHGNWPFNTAFAATQEWQSRSFRRGPQSYRRAAARRGPNQKLEAYVARFTGLSQAEEWIAAGVPVIVSVAWGHQELAGAPFPSSSGHLAVLVGFDSLGNPVLNDPGALSNETVQRTYLREQFEPLWLGHTGGTVYLIHPPARPVPEL